MEEDIEIYHTTTNHTHGSYLIYHSPRTYEYLPTCCLFVIRFVPSQAVGLLALSLRGGTGWTASSQLYVWLVWLDWGVGFGLCGVDEIN